MFQRPEFWIFLTVLVTHGYFYNGVGGNQNARFDPVYSFVEPGTSESGTLKMERFAATDTHPGNTHDWASPDWSNHQGRIYSTKAPGSILAAIPVYTVLFYGQKLLGIDATEVGPAIANTYLLNLFSILFTAWACVALFQFLGRGRDGLFLAFVYGFATLVFPFDTQYWGHPMSAAFLILSLIRLFSEPTAKNIRSAGLWGSLAVFTDYVAAVGWFMGGLYVFFARKKSHAIQYGLASVPIFLILMIYHKLCFGGWLTTGTEKTFPLYAFAQDRYGGQMGGLSLEIAWRLLFSLKRGMFLYMPVLGMALVGTFQQIQKREWKRVVFLWTVIGLMTLLVSTYLVWWGGWTSGPRYLIVALPYFCFLLPRLSSLTHGLRWTFATLAGFSFLNMLVIAAVNPMANEGFENPLYGFLYEEFFAGRFHQNQSPVRLFFEPAQMSAAVFNLGQRFLGLPSLATIVFFIILLGLGTYKTLSVQKATRKAVPYRGDPQ